VSEWPLLLQPALQPRCCRCGSCTPEQGTVARASLQHTAAGTPGHGGACVCVCEMSKRCRWLVRACVRCQKLRCNSSAHSNSESSTTSQTTSQIAVAQAHTHTHITPSTHLLVMPLCGGEGGVSCQQGLQELQRLCLVYQVVVCAVAYEGSQADEFMDAVRCTFMLAGLTDLTIESLYAISNGVACSNPNRSGSKASAPIPD